MVYEPLITHNIPYYAYTWVGKDFGPHWHSEMEVMSCIDGEILVKTDEREFLLTGGHTLFLPGNEPHRFEHRRENTQVMILKFGYSLLGSDFSKLQDKLIFTSNDTLPDNVRLPLNALRQRLIQDAVTSARNEWFIRGQLCLLAYGLQNLPASCRPSEKQSIRAVRLESIYPVLDFVRKHYREPITVDDAANLTGYAKTYFCRQFKLITGTSFHRYLNRFRISTACLLLENSGLSITQVAERTGFSSAKLFCRTFKEITGMTTGQYQKLPPSERNAHWMY